MVLRSALHAARGVPRLYRAAMDAGASPTQAAQLMVASAAALGIAARRGAGKSGRVNAVRHFVWQAYATARFGEPIAVGVAEAQERGTPDARDSRVDSRNNAVGQQYGRDHVEELRRGTAGAVLAHLADIALDKWESGELN